MLGGTIHDVAQVVGAGYAVSTPVGNTAVIVKLFRVFLLLPVVLGVGWYFTRLGAQARRGARAGAGVRHRVPFALRREQRHAACCRRCCRPMRRVKSVLSEVSTWGLLLAIGALGLGTSVRTIIALGWRHITTVLGATAVIFVVVTGGLVLMRAI